jgi:hypothetical protein
MAVGCLKLIGIALLISAATGASAQTLSPPAEVAVSPALPSTAEPLTSENTGRNPLTGLPCSGTVATSVTGAGGLGAAATVGSPSTTPQLPTVTSVFGSTTSLGAC